MDNTRFERDGHTQQELKLRSVHPEWQFSFNAVEEVNADVAMSSNMAASTGNKQGTSVIVLVSPYCNLLPCCPPSDQTNDTNNMPAPKAYRMKALIRAQDEAKIQQVIDSFNAGEHKSLRAAALKFGMMDKYYTIWRRFGGKAKPKCKAHMRQQLLNRVQENVLVEWIKFLGLTGRPLSKRTIAPKVTALCGRKPSRKWVYRFLKRHPDCTFKRPAGLEAKRARAFNFPVVNDHFEKLQRIIGEHTIPACNFWNADEIGIQLAGGRKGSPEMYLYAHSDTSQYKIQGDDLELISVIEVICADGTATVLPCFIFSGVKFCEEWFVERDGILCVIYSSYFYVVLTY